MRQKCIRPRERRNETGIGINLCACVEMCFLGDAVLRQGGGMWKHVSVAEVGDIFIKELIG